MWRVQEVVLMREMGWLIDSQLLESTVTQQHTHSYSVSPARVTHRQLTSMQVIAKD